MAGFFPFRHALAASAVLMSFAVAPITTQADVVAQALLQVSMTCAVNCLPTTLTAASACAAMAMPDDHLEVCLRGNGCDSLRQQLKAEDALSQLWRFCPLVAPVQPGPPIVGSGVGTTVITSSSTSPTASITATSALPSTSPTASITATSALPSTSPTASILATSASSSTTPTTTYVIIALSVSLLITLTAGAAYFFNRKRRGSAQDRPRMLSTPVVMRHRPTVHFEAPTSAFTTDPSPSPVYEKPLPKPSGRASVDLQAPARASSMLKAGFGSVQGVSDSTAGVSIMTVSSITAPPSYKAVASMLPTRPVARPAASVDASPGTEVVEPTPPEE